MCPLRGNGTCSVALPLCCSSLLCKMFSVHKSSCWSKALQSEGERTDVSTTKQTPVETERARQCRDTKGASVRNKNISVIACHQNLRWDWKATRDFLAVDLWTCVMLDQNRITLDYEIEYFAEMIPPAFYFSFVSSVMMIFEIAIKQKKVGAGVTCTFWKFHCLLNELIKNCNTHRVQKCL